MSDNNNNNNNESQPSEKKEEVREESNVPIDPKDMARIRAQIGKNTKTDTYILTKNDGEKRSIFKEITRKTTIFLKDNVNCSYNIDATCIKVLIQECHNCKIVFNEKVNTECVEIWNCNNTELIFAGAKVKTLQADMCKEIKLTYKKKNLFGSIVWAAVHDFELSIESDYFKSGLAHVQADPLYADMNINEQIDQFIVRYVKGKLLQEQIVRLENGFPTTDREADEFDRQKERNDKLYEEHVRALLNSKKAGVAEKLEKVSKVTLKPKVGRNELCPCNSGKKFKKCCEGKSDDDFNSRLEQNKAALKQSDDKKLQITQEMKEIADKLTAEKIEDKPEDKPEDNNNNNNNNQ